MKGVGAMIAKSVPPPDKLGADEPGEGTADEEATDEGDKQAAELSAMEAFDKAEGPEERLSALKDLLSTCGY